MSLRMMQSCLPDVRIRTVPRRNVTTVEIRTDKLLYKEDFVTPGKSAKTETRGHLEPEPDDTAARSAFQKYFDKVHHRSVAKSWGWYMLNNQGKFERVDKHHLAVLEFGYNRGLEGYNIRKERIRSRCNPAYGEEAYCVRANSPMVADEILGFYSFEAYMFMAGNETRNRNRLPVTLASHVTQPIAQNIYEAYREVHAELDSMVFEIKSTNGKQCFRGHQENVLCYVNDVRCDPNQVCKTADKRCATCRSLETRSASVVAVEYVYVDETGAATPHIVYWTTRDIDQDEELLMEYGAQYWHDRLPSRELPQRMEDLKDALHRAATHVLHSKTSDVTSTSSAVTSTYQQGSTCVVIVDEAKIPLWPSDDTCFVDVSLVVIKHMKDYKVPKYLQYKILSRMVRLRDEGSFDVNKQVLKQGCLDKRPWDIFLWLMNMTKE